MFHHVWESCALTASPWMKVAVPHPAAFAMCLSHGTHSQESAVPRAEAEMFLAVGRHCTALPGCSRAAPEFSISSPSCLRERAVIGKQWRITWSNSGLCCIPFFICRTEPLGECQRVDSVSKLLKTLQVSVLQNLDRSRCSRLCCIFDQWLARIRTKQILRIL